DLEQPGARTQVGQPDELVEERFRVARPGVVIQPRHRIKRRSQSLALVWHADHHGVGLTPEATAFLRRRYLARAVPARRPAVARYWAVWCIARTQAKRRRSPGPWRWWRGRRSARRSAAMRAIPPSRPRCCRARPRRPPRRSRLRAPGRGTAQE